MNVCRALDMAGHHVVAVDANPDHLVWCAEFAEIPFSPFASRELVFYPHPDVWYAQPDSLLLELARSNQPKLMPSIETLKACADKRWTNARWYAAGLKQRCPVVIEEPLPDWLHNAADTFGLPFWLRASSGAGARGATLVEEIGVGYHWVRYWQTRGVEWEFVAEEYLPERDFCWSSLWYEGELVGAFTRERLEWLYPHLAPSGRTGTPTISEVVHDRAVNEAAEAALRAIDESPHGIFCVDLREDRNGEPRPTEINAGRWATTSPLYAELGVNLPDMHVKLAAGEHVEPVGNDCYPAGVRLSRHIDCGHAFTNLPVVA